MNESGDQPKQDNSADPTEDDTSTRSKRRRLLTGGLATATTLAAAAAVVLPGGGKDKVGQPRTPNIPELVGTPTPTQEAGGSSSTESRPDLSAADVARDPHVAPGGNHATTPGGAPSDGSRGGMVLTFPDGTKQQIPAENVVYAAQPSSSNVPPTQPQG